MFVIGSGKRNVARGGVARARDDVNGADIAARFADDRCNAAHYADLIGIFDAQRHGIRRRRPQKPRSLLRGLFECFLKHRLCIIGHSI